MKQLPLPIRLDEAATLENFIAGRNAQLLHFLRHFLDGSDEQQAYLWARAARGKSHLLQAMCHRATAAGLRASYLPMADAHRHPTMFDGLERMGLVAVDDLHLVTAEPAWAEALFHLINRCRHGGCRLLLASRESPHGVDVALPDLASRLSWGPVFHLDPLDDAELLAFVFDRARRRGMELPAKVAGYLVRHLPREIGYLERLIELLDEETLAGKRKVTLPLLKQVVGQHGEALSKRG